MEGLIMTTKELDDYTMQLEQELMRLLQDNHAVDFEWERVQEIKDELEQIEMRGE